MVDKILKSTVFTIYYHNAVLCMIGMKNSGIVLKEINLKKNYIKEICLQMSP